MTEEPEKAEPELEIASVTVAESEPDPEVIEVTMEMLEEDEDTDIEPVIVDEEVVPGVDITTLDEEIVEFHDARWFTLKIYNQLSEGDEAAAICQELSGKNIKEIAKAIQQSIAPNGYCGHYSQDFTVTFYSFYKGIDCNFNGEQKHMTYTLFAQEIMALIEDGTIKPDPVETVATSQEIVETEPAVIEEEKDAAFSQQDEQDCCGLAAVAEYDDRILDDMINEIDQTLSVMRDYWQTNQPGTYTKYAMQLTAYNLLKDLHKEEPAPQPPLPIMRNKDQREKFLESYHDWPIWFKVPEASEVYYRYDLPDGSSIVICEYRVWYEWMEKYLSGNPDSSRNKLYLLKAGYHYLADCGTNTSALIDHLKEVQQS
jgi:hypothetical protein